MLRVQGAQGVNFLRLEHQALFAETVFARLQRILRDRVVHEQRRGDKYRFHRLGGEQFAIVLELFRTVADGVETVLEVLGIDIANCDATPVVNTLKVLEEIAAAAAGANNADRKSTRLNSSHLGISYAV